MTKQTTFLQKFVNLFTFRGNLNRFQFLIMLILAEFTVSSVLDIILYFRNKLLIQYGFVVGHPHNPTLPTVGNTLLPLTIIFGTAALITSF